VVLQDPQAPSDHQEDKGQLEHQRVQATLDLKDPLDLRDVTELRVPEDPLVHKAQLVPQDLMVVKEWSD